MISSFPTYPVWVVKSIYNGLKMGLMFIFNKIKEVYGVFYYILRGFLIGFYIINAALFGHEDKRIKQYGWTLKGMKQTAWWFWLSVIGFSTIILNSIYGLLAFIIFGVIFVSYSTYSDQKEEYYKKTSSFHEITEDIF
jgi:hypothetical protein